MTPLTSARAESRIHRRATDGKQSLNVRPDIQGLRAIAVLLVIGYHAGFPLSGGFTGVDVFFVISGFVITALLLRELTETGSIDFARFYVRRIRRLLPALGLVVATTAVLGWFLLPLQSQQSAGRTGVAASIFMANFEIMQSTGGYFDAAAEMNPLLHTWSLSVEEQFYVGFPALLLLGWTIRKRGGLARLAPAMLVTATLALSLGASIWLTRGWGLSDADASQEFAFYSSFTRAWQFAAGSLLALAWPVVTRVRTGLPSWAHSGLALVAASGLAAAAFTIDGTGYPGTHALAPTLATVLLIATTDVDRGIVGRTLASRPFVAIGDLSYSLYLWHWPALLLASTLIPDSRVRTNALIVLASAIPAYASYRWIENPLRRQASRTQRGSTLRVVVICISIPMVLSASLAWGSERSWWQADIAKWESLRQERPVGRALGCHSQPLDQPAAPASCIFGLGDRGLVLLLGDSHAAALGDSVIGALDQTGYRTAVMSVNGCPFLGDAKDWHQWSNSGRIQPCVRGATAQWAAIESLSPDVVIIANSSTRYVRNSPVHEDNVLAVGKWGSAIETTVRQVEARGVPVLLVNQVPDHPIGLALCTRSWGVDRSCVDNPSGGILRNRAAIVAIEEKAVTSSHRSATWDPALVMCASGLCSREFSGTPTYLDDTHVNPSARNILSSPIRTNLMPLLSGPSARQ